MKCNFAKLGLSVACSLLISNSTVTAAAEAPTFTVKMLTTETALKAAQAALAKCRKDGFQAAVAVVDRSGVVQVVLRDRYAGAHTPDIATAKAWTAASFKQSTGALAVETQAGKSMSGIRQMPRVAAIGGGLPINGGGDFLGAIAVSGAPGGDADEVCANAGIKAIADDIEF
ncbi:MAG: heme-binding protein [Betaproteobacteria bacterium]